jgi:hypothetical protein
MNNPVRFKKLRKLLRDPNLYFYDMFRKRVFKDSPPAVINATSAPEASNAPAIDLLEVKRLGLVPYIQKHLNAGIGAEDGSDPNSILIWNGYLPGLIGFVAGLKEAAAYDVTIYTLGGGFSVSVKSDEKFDQGRISKSLSNRPDFVIELSNQLGDLSILHIYLFDLSPTGEATVRSNRAWIRRFSISEIGDVFSGGGIASALNPIDAVYTWVNHSDQQWQEMWAESFPEEPFDPDRYTSNDELRYSLRSLYKYAPWLRKIYIVSNCAQPSWLDDHEKIVWIQHEEIFPDISALPTFNSHAIEACLHKINEISEQFIYLNDDFVLSQPCLPTDFFDETGRSIAYFEPYGMVTNNPASEDHPDYLVAAKNSRLLLQTLYPAYEARTLHRHVPYALKKSILERIEATFPDAFSETRFAKRRSNVDINLTSFLYHHFAFASGDAVRGDLPGLIVRPSNVQTVASKDAFKYKILCFNDGNGSSEDLSYKIKTQAFFDNRLPQRAPWEHLNQIPLVSES